MDVTVDDVPPGSATEPAAAVVWHDLECGGYGADMELWRELAADARAAAPSASILDVGAGSGRVTLALAGRGHALTALDLDPLLLSALRERAARAGLAIESVCMDARRIALERRDFGLCVIPMQTIQLLGGAEGRLAFLRGAREHLRAGALVACAIVTELEPFDCATGDVGPSPETMLVGGTHYSSRATAVKLTPQLVRIERQRTVARAGEQRISLNVIELDRVSAAELAREGRRAGLTLHAVREIEATDEHVGSEVVVLRA
jgi:SAM-dependent methyltransferase